MSVVLRDVPAGRDRRGRPGPDHRAEARGRGRPSRPHRHGALSPRCSQSPPDPHRRADGVDSRRDPRHEAFRSKAAHQHDARRLRAAQRRDARLPGTVRGAAAVLPQAGPGRPAHRSGWNSRRRWRPGIASSRTPRPRSSSRATAWWPTAPGPDFYSAIHTRGIGGDTTSGLLRRLDEITEDRPRKVFLLIGANDLAAAVPPARILRHLPGHPRADPGREPRRRRSVVIGVLPVNRTFRVGPTLRQRRGPARSTAGSRSWSPSSPASGSWT